MSRRTGLLTLLLLLAGVAPAHAAQGVIAAYDRYVTGRGFDIGMTTETGTQISVPATVNTTDDELHPTLSADGRYVTFLRMRLVPKLNGDVVPPAERTLFTWDRESGSVTALPAGPGPAGPVHTGTRLSFGIPHVQEQIFTGAVNVSGRLVSKTVSFAQRADGTAYGPAFGRAAENDPAGKTQLTTHVAGATIPSRNPDTGQTEPAFTRFNTYASVDAATGATVSAAHITAERRQQSVIGVGGEQTLFPDAGHAVPRPADGYAALHTATGGNADIQTLSWPVERTATPAPSSINSGSPEHFPAWSPDSLKLGFVRSSTSQRSMGIFDLTPGIQSPLNGLVSLGPVAPTPQLRALQHVWGGLSLATAPASTAPVVTCDAICLSRLRTTVSTTTLSPLSPTVVSGTRIGILVNRVTGTRKLFGRTVPRLRSVGRVPLGALRRGRNRFRWDGRVGGRRLAAGTYVLTFRALRGDAIVSTSQSLRFVLDRRGRITRVSRLR